jgi:hypothetical protein
LKWWLKNEAVVYHSPLGPSRQLSNCFNS